jgi:hypothetical protein
LRDIAKDIRKLDPDIDMIVAGKVLEEMAPQPKTEYTLEELLAETDRWERSHAC